MEKKMEKGKNIMIMEKSNSKENIYIMKEMEKEKNMMKKEN